MKLEDLTIVWITRKDENETKWLKEYFDKYKNVQFKKMIVGYSELNEQEYDYKYISFWENGINEMGLLCHKKNIAVNNCSTENIIILHADCFLIYQSIEFLKQIEFDEKTAYGVVGYMENTDKRGFTWLDRSMTGEDFVNLPLEEMIKTRDTSIICGSAIAGKKSIFLKTPWNETLRHNQGEDGELCTRLVESGINLVCLPDLIINMKNDR